MIFDDPYTQRVVEQERLRRRRRRTRLVVGGAVGVVLTAAVAAGLVLYSADAHEVPAAAPSADASGTTASASPGAGSLPSGAPSALPSLLALPVVRPEQAFPERAVRLADGSWYDDAAFEQVREPGKFLIRRALIEKVGEAQGRRNPVRR